MNYSEWAPLVLVEWHKSLLESNSLDKKAKNYGIAGLKAFFKKKDMEKDFYNKFHIDFSLLRLPDNEREALLGKLITDQRMKGAWKTLDKRIIGHYDYVNFFYACEDGIKDWRGDSKQTISERKAYYQEIHDDAYDLMILMSKTNKFYGLSPAHLIEDEKMESLMEALDIQEDEFTRSSLSESMPSYNRILFDIMEKALIFGKETPVVKKPNSPNADIHYFVRSLSLYLKKTYKQPLHEVVATTTAVVFDQQNIDSDYIRKLVK